MRSAPNQANNHKEMKQKHLNEIKNLSQGAPLQGWFFNACLLTFPETMIVQGQIRQAVFVFEEEQPQQVLVVTLSEYAVRRYCNILKPFHKYQFIDGVIKTSYLNNIFVLIAKQSKIVHIEQGNLQKWKPMQNYLNHSSQNNFKRMQKQQQHKKYSVRLKLPNIPQQCGYLFSDDKDSDELCETRSERIQYKKQSPKEELVNFCGTVKGIYEVGKGKMNHGIGYRIEQYPSKVIYEVVVWCEMQCGPLRKGKTYEFTNFRIHKKPNLETSYHSHPQLSAIKLLF